MSDNTSTITPIKKKRKVSKKYKKIIPEEDKKLNYRELKFAEVYAKTNDRLTAYKSAGYKYEKNGEPVRYLANRLYELANRPRIDKYVREYREKHASKEIAEHQLGIDKVKTEHWNYYQELKAKGDASNATKNLELYGKTEGAYVEGNRLDIDRLTTLNKLEQGEARKISRLLITETVTRSIEVSTPDPADTQAQARKLIAGSDIARPLLPIAIDKALEANVTSDNSENGSDGKETTKLDC